MQRLFLIRHGPTHAKGMIGWTDLPPIYLIRMRLRG